MYIQYLTSEDQSKVIVGAAEIQASIGVLSSVQWHSARLMHCISGALPYANATYAWQMTNARWFAVPKPRALAHTLSESV